MFDYCGCLRAVPARLVLVILGVMVLSGCAPSRQSVPLASQAVQMPTEYLVGPGDSLDVFVWRNPELSVKVAVRPDGRISIPLVEDIECSGKTPTQLARDIEERLRKYVNDPVVTVIVSGFVGPLAQQVRVVGEAQQPQAIPYRQQMTVLDAMIAVGGLKPFAAGNRATLVRSVNGSRNSYRIRLDDLLKDGDVTANAELQPGDIIIIPQSYF